MSTLAKPNNLSLQEYLTNYANIQVHGINLSIEEIEDIALSYIVEKLDDNDIPVEYGLVDTDKEEWLLENGENGIYINGIKLVGSRIKGGYSTSSDLDVIFEYEGDFREEFLFDVLNEEPLELENSIAVDFNPITATKTGTIDFWLKQNFSYNN